MPDMAYNNELLIMMGESALFFGYGLFELHKKPVISLITAG